ncbi:MAG: hypothetical protein RR356_04605 [Bacteroidales bacterium]
MKFLYVRFIFFCLLLTGLVSCNSKSSDQVEQRLIFPSYIVSYNAITENLTASATFQENNESGLFIRLSRKSKVTFNEIELKKSSTEKVKGISYMLTQHNMAQIPAKLNFVYVNDDGRSFSNHVILNTIAINHSFVLGKQDHNIIKYIGKNIDENESLILHLHNDKNSYELTPNPLFGSTLELTADMLFDVEAGEYEAYFVRTYYSTNVEAMDRGGISCGKYESKKVKVTVQ